MLFFADLKIIYSFFFFFFFARLAKIYSAAQGKVGRNRKGEKEHPLTQEVRARGSKFYIHSYIESTSPIFTFLTSLFHPLSSVSGLT
jgi:hypothetical protein